MRRFVVFPAVLLVVFLAGTVFGMFLRNRQIKAALATPDASSSQSAPQGLIGYCNLIGQQVQVRIANETDNPIPITAITVDAFDTAGDTVSFDTDRIADGPAVIEPRSSQSYSNLDFHRLDVSNAASCYVESIA